MRWILLVLCMASVAHARPSTESVLVLNTANQQVELQRNQDRVRSIASLTKIMTAMVALDYDKDLSRRLPLSRRVGSHLPKQEYTREQLLEAMLVKSDNAAAETLAEDYPGGRQAFISQMNQQARAWNLVHTKFDDASGLSSLNVSTVAEVAQMMDRASNYWFIRDTSTKKQVAFETRYRKQIRTIKLHHTSESILFSFDNIVVSKTGLTSAAGWCVGLVVRQGTQNYVIVVLGSANKTQRLNTVKDLMYNHVLDRNLQHVEIVNNYN